jgi:hypothetical protein
VSETGISGDAEGPVLSGAFHGPVTINAAGEQPRTAREYLDAMWKMLLLDQHQRWQRQQETDKERRAVRLWLMGLTSGMCLLAVGQVIWAWAWFSRFGWLLSAGWGP